jgi:PAS domain S-box-containing protein
MLLFAIILAVIAASAIITHQKVEKANEQEKIASSIAQGASELSYLSNDYLIYRESQQLSRWQSRFASFSSEVARLRAEKPEQQALIRNIQANEQRLKQVFDSVASAVGPSQKRSTALDLAFLQVSWSRMAVQSQGLASDASQLSQLLHQQMDQLTNTRTMLIYFMVGLFGAFLLASYMLTYRRILKSIVTLQARTAIIGSGNLDFIIEEKRNDEIGDLSHAFNQMTINLKAVTASKADLEREVTERKRAEEDLRHQREWLRVTLSSMGDAVIASDTEGRITFLNPVAVTLTGWQLEETLGQPIRDVFRIINEKTHAPAEDLVARVLNEKRVVGLANDTALVTKDGREVPIEDSAAPIQDSAGNLIGVVLVFHDVTEKRHAQTALREALERAVWLGRFPEENPNPVLRVSADGTMLYCNPASAEIPGWGCEVGKPLQGPLLLLLGQAMLEGKEATQDMELGGRSYSVSVTPFPGEGYANVYGRDITERKRAEAALRESEKRYRSYIEVTEQLGWSTIADGEVVEGIPSWRNFTGQSEEEVKGWGWSKALHPDDLDHTARVWRNAVATRNKYEVEYRIRRYDGVYRHFLARGVPVFKDDGNILEWVGICVDITERKRAEEALRQSEERLSRAQEIAHLGSWELDLINNRLTWSDEVYRIFGLRPQEFGATYEAFLERVYPDDRAAVDAAYSGSLREGRDTYEIEHRMVRKLTGEIRTVHERCEHIRDASGRIIRSVGMVHDITERKLAEEAIARAKEEWERTFDTVPDLVSILDNQHRIVRVNKAMADRLALKPEQCIGLKCYEAVHGLSDPTAFCPHALTCQDGQQHVAEVHEPRLGGDFLVSTTPLCNAHGQLIGAVHVARDITQRKRAEEALRQRTLELQQLTETLEQQVQERTAELGAANDELRNQIDECARIESALKKSESDLRHLSVELLNAQEKERKMIAGEIHDSIGSSLSAIKFKVENALTEVVDKSPETTTALKSVIPIVQGAIEEARRIQMNLRPSMLDDLGILATISWFCRQFESTYSKIRISQSIEIEEHEVPGSLRTVIFRVLQEGLNNIAKHSTAKVASLSLRKTDQTIELVIQDNGQGFDLSKAQAPEGTTHGLGLESMRERTELSGGAFVIESTQGKGTMIRVSWPVT